MAGEAKNIYYLAFYGKKKKPADFQNKGLSPNPIWNIKHLWSTLIWQDLSTQNESSQPQVCTTSQGLIPYNTSLPGAFLVLW